MFLNIFKECCVLESNLRPHGGHVYLSFPVVADCGATKIIQRDSAFH
jgi:hypothetical protein